MKSITIGGILFFLLCFLPKWAMAQSENFSIVIIKVQEDEKKLLESTKPNLPTTPKVPDFILKDESGYFILALGGYINPIVGWDLGNDLPSINFSTNLIPVPAVKGYKSDFFINPLKSAFDMHIVGLPNTPNQIVGYVKMKYDGPQRGAKLNSLYVTYRRFTVGRNTSIFSDGASMPTTIDPQGAPGALSVHTYQITYNSKSYNGFSFGASIELPSFEIYKGPYHGKDYPEFDGSQYYGDASQSCPDFPVYVQYKGKNDNRIRLGGIIRNFRYRNIQEDWVHNVLGWGVMLSGNLKPCKDLTLYYQGSYGKGIANYYQDLNGLPLSYIPKEKPGHMKSSPMMGWLGGAKYKFSDKVNSSVVVSQNKVWNTSEYYPQYRYGFYVAANVFYNIASYLQWGMEYIYGKLDTYDKGHASDNRIQTTLRFSL